MASWGLGIGAEDFEVELFINDLPFLLAGGGQEIVGQIHEQAQVAAACSQRVWSSGALMSLGCRRT